MIQEIKQSAKGVKGYWRHKNVTVLQSVFITFFMSQTNQNDQIVVNTLQHITIISDKFLKPNEIKNQEVPYW